MLQRTNLQEPTSVSKSKWQDIHFLIDLLEKLQPHILKCLNHFSIHPDDKEDLQQEILFKLFKALRQFDFSKEIPLAHYVNRTIKNTKNDYIRKKLADLRRQRLLENEMLISVQMLRQARQTDEIILRKETLAMLHQSIEKLTELEQGIINYILNDYKPSEIACILNLNVKIVYNTIHRCKLKLKRTLNPKRSN